MKKDTPLELIKRVKALAETGLLYAQNEYDTERYVELRKISFELLAEIMNTPLKDLHDFFLPAKDYPTPKVDVRGLVLNEAKEVLLVKESADQKWSLPGGWGEIGFSPSEVIEKEIKEETGLEAKALHLLAVYDKRFHPHPPQPFYVYKMVFYCKAVGGQITSGFDMEGVAYFRVQDLPELSEDRILQSQILQLYEKAVQEDFVPYFD